MIDTPKETFSRWWWPVQWFQIVYGVWIDQMWYWKNVRPHLKYRTRLWKIIFQAFLGSVLLVITLSLLLLVLLKLIGVAIYWDKWFLFLVVDISAVVCFLLLISFIGKIWKTFYASVAALVTLITSSGLLFSVLGALGLNSDENILFIILFGIGGLSLSITNGVDSGLSWNRNYLLGVLLIILFIAFERGINMAIVFGISLLLALYVGGCWSTRQVADEKLRERLANPNE